MVGLGGGFKKQPDRDASLELKREVERLRHTVETYKAESEQTGLGPPHLGGINTPHRIRLFCLIIIPTGNIGAILRGSHGVPVDVPVGCVW